MKNANKYRQTNFVIQLGPHFLASVSKPCF